MNNRGAEATRGRLITLWVINLPSGLAHHRTHQRAASRHRPLTSLNQLPPNSGGLARAKAPNGRTSGASRIALPLSG